MVIRLSSSALDMIATDLSQFTKPNVPELTLAHDQTLQNNMLASIMGVFGGSTNAKVRHLMTNIVRRVFAAIETYKRGREYALNYVQGDRRNQITPYFHALTYFETCVGYSWQVADLLRDMSAVDLYPRGGDGSIWHRLNDIYNEGTKHSFGKYENARDGELPTTIWLTNEGIACVNGQMIAYRELVDVIHTNNELFYQAQERAQEKRRAARQNSDE